MTLTMRLHDSPDRTILWGVLLSLMLHGVLLLPGIRDAIQSLDIEFEEDPVIVPLEFTLVSPPENPTPSKNVSRFFSTINAAARDNVRTDDQSDVPHGEGISPFPDTPSPEAGADGGGASDVPPLPEEVSDLGEAFERSKFIEQSSPQREPALPEQNPDYYNEGSAMATIGGISLNTTAWNFAPYLLDLKHRIRQHWIPPLAFTAMGAIHGYTWIRFRIYPDGHMETMEIVETWGHKSLHRSSANAVKGADPFRDLPKDFPEDYLEITFGFYYLLPGDEQRFLKDRERRGR